MKDLNARQETIKIPEENTGSNLFDIGHSNFSLEHVFRGKWNKSKNELLGPHENKKLVHSQGNNQQT